MASVFCGGLKPLSTVPSLAILARSATLTGAGS
jgi:hypothetical protein